MLTTIITLLIAFQLKHLLYDYLFQTEYMLGKFKAKGWVLPLLSHALMNGLGTFAVLAIVYNSAYISIKYALLDTIAHFIMDRIKASPNIMGRWTPLTAEQYMFEKSCVNASDERLRNEARKALMGNRLFWFCIGIDQCFHHLTHYFIIWSLVK